MEGTLKTILLGLVILSTTACLGDDPDHTDAVGSSVTLSPKISQLGGLPSGFHTRLLKMIGSDITAPSQQQADVKLNFLSDWAMTIGAPELCQGCTASLVHNNLSIETNDGATNSITIWDDARGVDVCTISLRLNVNAKTVILADNCGTTNADTTPPSFGGARQD